jgi:hypothetical protein
MKSLTAVIVFSYSGSVSLRFIPAFEAAYLCFPSYAPWQLFMWIDTLNLCVYYFDSPKQSSIRRMYRLKILISIED